MWRPFIPGHLKISRHTARRIRISLRENGSGSLWTVTGQSNLSSTPYGFIVAIQVNINTAVGIAIIIVISPKNAFTSAPAPIVKKWCNHTDSASDDTAAPTANAAMAVHADVRVIPDMWFPFGHHECC